MSLPDERGVDLLGGDTRVCALAGVYTQHIIVEMLPLGTYL